MLESLQIKKELNGEWTKWRYFIKQLIIMNWLMNDIVRPHSLKLSLKEHCHFLWSACCYWRFEHLIHFTKAIFFPPVECSDNTSYSLLRQLWAHFLQTFSCACLLLLWVMPPPLTAPTAWNDQSVSSDLALVMRWDHKVITDTLLLLVSPLFFPPLPLHDDSSTHSFRAVVISWRLSVRRGGKAAHVWIHLWQ